MRFTALPLLAAGGLLASLLATGSSADEKKVDTSGASPKPLKALLVAGGCCHDYGKQKDILKAGLEQRANIVVDICYNEDKGTKPLFSCYEKADWSAGYDIVIHDECAADVKDVPYVTKIVDAHKNGVPAVNLHCAMHCYRVGNFGKPVTPGSPDALWFDMLGLQSSGHGPQEPIAINFCDKAHPITASLSNWTTIKEELYNNISVFPGAHALAKGTQKVKDKDVETVVAWTNEFGPKKTRIFSTTLGHNNETVADDRYLDFVAHGVLWACGKLDDKGQPAAGYGPVKAAK